MKTNKIQWKRIAGGEELPSDSLLMRYDGTITTVGTCAGVKVGQYAYYLPVEELRTLPKEEGKDDKIRKEIIDFVKSRGGFKGDWIAWLEKRVEHDNFCNKIQIGDNVTRNEDGVLVNLSQLKRVAKKDEKQGEQNHSEWNREDEQNLNVCLGYIPDEYLRRWLIDVVHIKYDKPAWSEEDEDMCYKATAVINRLCADGKEYVWSIGTLKTLFYWLKSLKDRVQLQNTWKPSEEQMAALENVVKPFCKGYGWDETHLGVLYNELKKLRMSKL